MIDQSSSDIWGHPIPLMHSQLKPYLARLRRAHLTYLQTHRKDFSTHLETQTPRCNEVDTSPSSTRSLSTVYPVSCDMLPQGVQLGGTGVVQHRVQFLRGSMYCGGHNSSRCVNTAGLPEGLLDWVSFVLNQETVDGR